MDEFSSAHDTQVVLFGMEALDYEAIMTLQKMMKTKTLNFKYTVPVNSSYGSIEQNMMFSITNRFIGYTFSQNVADNVIQQRLSNDNVEAVLTYVSEDDTEITGEVTGNPKDVKKMCEELVSLLNELIDAMWNNDIIL